MAKVFSIHPVRLKSGVDCREFERFVAEELYRRTVRDGVAFSVVRGDRGERAGAYLLIVEYADAATRDRYWPAQGEPSAEAEELLDAWCGRWFMFVAKEEEHTDYVTVGR